MRRIAIFGLDRHEPSDTFVHSHVTRLRGAFEVSEYYGGVCWLLSDGAGASLWPRARHVGAIARRLAPAIDDDIFSWLLAQRLRRMRVHAVLAEYGTLGAALVEATRRAGVPLLVFFRGFDISVRSLLQAHADAYRQLFRHAAALIGVSRPIVERLRVMGAPTERLHLNPSGIDPDRFHGASPETSPPHFLAVGRLIEKKAPHLTILAFDRVAKVCPDARLTIVGDGPLLGISKQVAVALGLESQVTFLGAQSSQTVSELMRRSRVFVQHSLEAEDGDSEGTPNSVMEAQMSGLPVVATRHGGIPDVVSDGETGFLVPEGAALEMGDEMLRLACDPKLAGAMGRKGRERALEHCTLDRHMETLFEIIDRSIAEHEQRGRRVRDLLTRRAAYRAELS